MKTEGKIWVKRFVIFALMFALGVAALILLMSLLNIAALSIDYSEALSNGQTALANIIYKERLALSNGNGLTAFLYNLPSAIKFFLTMISLGILIFISYFFYMIIKAINANQKKYEKVATKRSW